jgi:uncharacterized protein
VEPEAWGDFLVRVFDEWRQNDAGRVFVMNFEWTLGAFAGAPPGVCHHAARCGRNLILEHNGDVYACDHFMYPSFRLGNILEKRLAVMVESRTQRDFGAAKETGLPLFCRNCPYLFACRGGCPKHRFLHTPDGEPGLNHLCAGFRKFYAHADPVMRQMAGRLAGGVPT